MANAIGMIEYTTVSTGVQAADTLVKTADVEIIEAQVVCPGKYIVIISGELSAIKASVDAAKVKYGEKLIDSFVLGNVHEGVFPAIYATVEVENPRALGVVETFSGASAIVAGVPVRYAHASNCISTEFDFEATVQMVIALLENIDADVIRGM